MKAAHLREKSQDDLVELHKSLSHDVFENRLKNFTNRLDDTSAIRKTRRDVARVATLLRERTLSAATETAKAAPAAAAEAAPAAAPAKKKSSKKSEAKS